VKTLAWGLVLLTLAGVAHAEGLAPDGLMCELLARPQAVEITTPRPRLSWVVHAKGNDQTQSAYEIKTGVAAAPVNGWDSGKVISDQSTAVEYAGPALRPSQAYAWQVRTWDKNGDASPWSAAQQFRTGAFDGGAGDRGTVSRYPLEQTAVLPVQVIAVEKGHYFLDFGRAAYAALKITADGPDGAKVVVHMGEALAGAHEVKRKPQGSVRYHQAQITLTAGMRTYVVPLDKKDARRMPAEIGPVMPFRYVELEGWPGDLKKESVVQWATHYPFDDTAAQFVSSDKPLNNVWELCKYSIKATSFCGVYVDGDRERTPYEADAYINQLGQYCCDREYTLARYSHEYLLQHPTWPTEWPLHSVMIAWADYMYTGDDRSIAAFYNDLKEKTLYRLERNDGLISIPAGPRLQEVLKATHETKLRDIVDWPTGERDGCDMKPINTVVNAFHCHAMELMAKMAALEGKTGDAKFFSTAAARVKAAINEKLFDESTGLYIDGEGSTHSSLHANMMPLAFGIVPADRAAKVAAFVKSRGMACSVYGAQYLMEALYASGQADHARALMTAKGDRSWAHMLEVGTTITLEAWDDKYKPNEDWNHAWGAAPANVIPRLLMGIEPLEPGFRTVRIRPQPGGLERAAMEMPTVRGPVHVDFAEADGKFVLHLALPANAHGEVWMPAMGRPDARVTVDGMETTGRIDGAFVVIESIGSGQHTVER
jgi:alpha-L-rhamnosidase